MTPEGNAAWQALGDEQPTKKHWEACFVCDSPNWCSHREPEVEAAYREMLAGKRGPQRSPEVIREAKFSEMRKRMQRSSTIAPCAARKAE